MVASELIAALCEYAADGHESRRTAIKHTTAAASNQAQRNSSRIKSASTVSTQALALSVALTFAEHHVAPNRGPHAADLPQNRRASAILL